MEFVEELGARSQRDDEIDGDRCLEDLRPTADDPRLSPDQYVSDQEFLPEVRSLEIRRVQQVIFC